MQTHVKVLAILLIVLGAFGVLGALFLMLMFGGVAGLAGMSGDADAAIAAPIIGVTGTALAIGAMIISLPALITGWGLLKLKPWARIVGIVICALNLINFPFGTLVGAYGLWVLLSAETERMFAGTGPITTA